MAIGNLAVERHGHLERDVRPTASHGGEEGAVLTLGLLLQHPDGHLDPRCAEQLQSLSGHPRIGIDEGRNDSADTGRGHAGRAGWRASEVCARFQCHVERAVARPIAGHVQGLDLGVGLSRAPVKSLRHDRAVADDHGSDHGIRRCEATAVLGQLERAAHAGLVDLEAHHASGTKASTKRAASKGWRSSIFSPTPMIFTGSFSSRTMRTTIPPFAVPSSLVRHTPVSPIAS